MLTGMPLMAPTKKLKANLEVTNPECYKIFRIIINNKYICINKS